MMSWIDFPGACSEIASIDLRSRLVAAFALSLQHFFVRLRVVSVDRVSFPRETIYSIPRKITKDQSPRPDYCWKRGWRILPELHVCNASRAVATARDVLAILPLGC